MSLLVHPGADLFTWEERLSRYAALFIRKAAGYLPKHVKDSGAGKRWRRHCPFFAIMEQMKRHIRIPVSVGIGEACSGLTDIHSSYNEAAEALLYEKIAGEGSIISIRDMQPKCPCFPGRR